MNMRRFLLGLVALVVIVGAGTVALAWRPAMDPIDPAAVSPPDSARIAAGARLALMGDCVVCHTRPDGKPYSGGAPLPTPFGTIYATNITPDPDTGIGRWSEAAFRRAMREGVDRKGSHLYPAFPYDHFTRMTDEDIGAVYAFLMSREPVRQETPRNQLPFPLGFRPVLAGWKLLFLDTGPFRTVAGQSAEWNRGAYLAEAVAHCGACHTPRNRLGAEQRDKAYAGGSIEGWHAPALNRDATAPVPWTADRVFAYLRGVDPQHGAAAGPMAPVTHNLARADEADVRAIAAYIGSMAPPGRAPSAAAVPSASGGAGNAIYAAACASCHRGDGPIAARGVPLALSSAVTGPDPRNLIHIVLDGIHPEVGEAGAIMPGFAAAMTDAQIAALATYLRSAFGGGPAWTDVEGTVRRIRQGKETS
ncbi:cytochrome c [Azospirillum sp.]|uniref:cytochrome c n=1 Tax=Azospirillum sp. TaxID=34012 RepID=UPI003D744227